MWVIRFPPTVPYNRHFLCFPNTSSATELVTVTLQMEAVHSFQMSELVPQGPSNIQQPLYKPENVHGISCCQIPATEAENTVLEGPSVERTM